MEEILTRITKVKNDDPFSFEIVDLAVYLPYDVAKTVVEIGATPEVWAKPEPTPRERILHYLPFAWEKCCNERGLSAFRSLAHMRAWLWLDGQDEFLAENDLFNYSKYGRPQLAAISKLYEYDHSEWNW